MTLAGIEHLIGFFSRSSARSHRRVVDRLEAYRARKFGPPESAPVKKKGRRNG